MINILFLAADPIDAVRLRLGEEAREIQDSLQLAKLRDLFEFHQRLSVRPADISRALLDTNPEVVHFSGHGTDKGTICVEDISGRTHPIPADALAALFEQFESQIHCVLLNACYSEAQARAIANHIDYVIGMNEAIGDKSAIAFAVGFYQALGAGRSIEDAYKLGCAQIRLENAPEFCIPVLIKGKKPSQQVLPIPQLTIGWRRREEISPAEWVEIFAQAQQRIWLLGHSMLKTVDRQYSGKILAERLAKGVDLRLVLLDPYDIGNYQINEIAKELKDTDLRRKIKKTLQLASSLSSEEESQFSIGITQATIHNSIVIVDDRFLVTLYSHNWEMGNAGITFDLSKVNPAEKEVCDFFEKDFIWHWQRSYPFFDEEAIPPRVELRILQHLERIKSSLEWYENPRAKLLPPQLTVINPTYRCRHGVRKEANNELHLDGPFADKLLCPNCMYGPLLNPIQKREMPINKFVELCIALSSLGTNIIELAGGGEPLHHSMASELIESVRAIRTDGRLRAETEVGLISNVSSLQDCDFQASILKAMSYVRWSWPEGAELQFSLRDRYMHFLEDFLRLREQLKDELPRNIRVGVKVLITKDNVQRDVLLPLIRRFFEIGIDHVKVRTLRSKNSEPTLDQIRYIEDAFARLAFQLQQEGVLYAPKSFEVDVRERRVPQDYLCKISPLISVIEPNGDMRMCWNDLQQDRRRVIGNVFDIGGFESVWGSQRHWNVCHEMAPRLVCNSLHSCHCRMVGYQETVERLMGGQVLNGRSDSATVFSDGFL